MHCCLKVNLISVNAQLILGLSIIPSHLSGQKGDVMRRTEGMRMGRVPSSPEQRPTLGMAEVQLATPSLGHPTCEMDSNNICVRRMFSEEVNTT